jgi:CheY-like chemotaxis protein
MGSHYDYDAARFAPSTDWHSAREHQHFVQFYERDTFLIQSLERFVSAGLTTGGAAIVIATRAHREALEREWHAHGIDVDAARKRGQYTAVDAREALAQFMRAGKPDERRFGECIGGLIAGARQRCDDVRAFSGMASLLWTEGQRDAAFRVEQLWANLTQRHAFAVFCAYPMSCFDGDGSRRSLFDVCDAHAHVIPAESYAASPSAPERLRAILALQHKAARLDGVLQEWAQARETWSKRERELVDAQRRNDELLATLSDELRNPLSAMAAAVGLMRQVDNESYWFARVRELIERQVNRMAHAVDHLVPRSARAPGNTADASPGTRTAPDRATPRLRVLVVDDNVDAGEALAQFMQLSGHLVSLAHNGFDAIEAAARLRPQVAILDIGMPGMDGCEIARRLRTDLGLHSVLLIALTGLSFEQDHQRTRAAGFDHHLVKPVNLERLGHLIGIWSKSARETLSLTVHH